jgi:catechol 2,3-dioxygenase-like lactoylglutathione lyase family enzyme
LSRHIRTHHVGITVSSLDQWLAFLSAGFGLQPSNLLSSDSPEVAIAVGLIHARARIAFLELPDSTQIELIEYLEPRGRQFDRISSDIGASHVCIEVSDIDEAIAHLEAAGARFFSPPVTIKGGNLVGWRFVYFREPTDGVVLELIQRGFSL